MLIFDRCFVMLDFSSLMSIFVNGKKLIKVGSNKNVTVKDTTKPNVIIQPKSIIGLIPLKINDKKAQIVVRTV